MHKILFPILWLLSILWWFPTFSTFWYQFQTISYIHQQYLTFLCITCIICVNPFLIASREDGPCPKACYPAIWIPMKRPKSGDIPAIPSVAGASRVRFPVPFRQPPAAPGSSPETPSVPKRKMAKQGLHGKSGFSAETLFSRQSIWPGFRRIPANPGIVKGRLPVV